MKKHKVVLLKAICLLFLSILIISSCKQENIDEIEYNKSTRDYFDISDYQMLDINFIDKINLSEIVDAKSVKYLPLAPSSSKSLIENINKIHLEKGRYFLFDQEDSKKVMCFDTLGNFLFETIEKETRSKTLAIGNSQFETAVKGRKRGELDNPEDFILNSKGDILIPDPPSSLISYDLSGKLKNQTTVPVYVKEMEELNRSNYLVFGYSKEYEIGETTNRYNLFIISNDFTNISKHYFPSNDLDDAISNNLISKYGDNFTFARSHFKRIYTINKNGVLRPRFYVNFGKFNIPEELLQELDIEKIEKGFWEGQYATEIENIVENDEYFLFQFYISSVDSEHKWFAIHSKSTGITIATKKVINDIDGGLYEFPINTNNNTLLSVLYPSLLKESEVLSSHNGLEEATNFQQMVDTLEYEDNPVIMLHEYKKNIDFDLLISRGQ